MKALQNDSQWVSQVYKQDALDDNWIVGEAHLTQNVERYGIKPGASTSSITVATPESGIVAGTTQLRLANASEVQTITAGTTTATAMSANGTSASAHTISTVAVNGNYYGATKFLPDGTVYRIRARSTTIDHCSLATPGDLLSAHTLIASYSFPYPYYVGTYDNIFFVSSDGQYLFMHVAYTADAYEVVRRFTLDTPFDLTTVNDNYVDYDLTTLWTSGSIGDSSIGGIASITFSPDGTKGVFCACATSNMSATANSGGAINFQCSVPYDLSTATASQYRVYYNSYMAGAIEFTPDGNFFYWGLMSNATAIPRLFCFASASPFQVPEPVGAVQSLTALFNAFNDSSSAGSTNSVVCVPTFAPWGNYLYMSFVSGPTSVRLEYSNVGTNGSTYVSANQSTVDISSAGLSSAPTVVGPPAIKPSLGIKSSSTATDYDIDYASLFIENTSATSSTLALGALPAYGSTALQTGDEVIIDGQKVTLGTVTGGTSYHTSNLTNPTTWVNMISAYDYSLSSFSQSGGSQAGLYFNSVLDFSSDGKLMVWGDQSSYNLFYYRLSIPYEISSATLIRQVTTTSSSWTQGTSGYSNQYVQDGQWSHDGNYFFLMRGDTAGSNPRIFRFPLNTPFDIPLTAVPDNFTPNIPFTYPTGFQFVENGNYFFVSYYATSSSTSSHNIAMYSCSTPYDLSSMTAVFTNRNIYSTSGYPNSAIRVKKLNRNGDYWWFACNRSNSKQMCGNWIGGLSNLLGSGNWNIPTTSVTLVHPDTLYYGASMYITPNLDKLIMVCTQSSGSGFLTAWTGVFGDIQYRFSCDISASGLTPPFKYVQRGERGAFTSLTPDSTTETEKTIVQNYDAFALNARAVKFSIDGSQNAVINKVELDLST